MCSGLQRERRQHPRLSLLLRRHEAVICAESAHINTTNAARRADSRHEAPDGPGAGRKLTPEMIAAQLSARGDDHRAQPGAVVITQTTELGTCYTLEELRKIGEFCRPVIWACTSTAPGWPTPPPSWIARWPICRMRRCAELRRHQERRDGAEAVIVMRHELAADVRTYGSSNSSWRRKCGTSCAIPGPDRGRAVAAQRVSRERNGRRLADGVRDIPGSTFVTRSSPTRSSPEWILGS